MAVADGDVGAGDDDALDAGVAAGFQDPQGAFAGRDDDVIFVFRIGGREWGRDVKHVLAAVDGFGPAGVGGQISAREGEPITGVGAAGGDHVADFALEG